jgi:hypothetical protein
MTLSDAFFTCSASQNSIARFIAVVDFVTVKAPKNHKDQ